MNQPPPTSQTPTELPKPPSPLNQRTLWGIAVTVAFFWSLWEAGLFQKEIINIKGWTLATKFLIAAAHPTLSPEFLQLTLTATLTTLSFAVCGTTLCSILGLIGGVLSSEVWWEAVTPFPALPRSLVRTILAIPRSIHELIWGLFFINIFGLDPLVALLAIAIPFGAITAKVFSEILDETPRQPLQALLNNGVPPLTAFIYALIPQAFPNLISYSFYRFECSIRSASVLGIIGAGGLGYQIFLSLQSLRYEQMWTFFIALVLLCGLTDCWSGLLRRRIGAPSRLDLNVLTLKPRQHLFSKKDPIVTLSFILFVILTIFSFNYIHCDYSKLFSLRSGRLLMTFLQDSFPPDFSRIHELMVASGQTLAMSILAMVGAGLASIILAFPAASNFLLPGGILDSGGRSNRGWGIALLSLSRLFLLVARAIPEPIWALILLFILFPGILPGAIALGLHNFGIMGRLMAEVIENLDPRPVRSLKALGASAATVFLYGILPRTLPRFAAYILYRWEVCIRSTVIVGLVGAGGLGRFLTEQLSSFDYQSLAATLIIFMGLTAIVDLISVQLRRCFR